MGGVDSTYQQPTESNKTTKKNCGMRKSMRNSTILTLATVTVEHLVEFPTASGAVSSPSVIVRVLFILRPIANETSIHIHNDIVELEITPSRRTNGKTKNQKARVRTGD